MKTNNIKQLLSPCCNYSVDIVGTDRGDCYQCDKCLHIFGSVTSVPTNENWISDFDDLDVFEGNVLHGRTGFQKGVHCIPIVREFIKDLLSQEKKALLDRLGGLFSYPIQYDGETFNIVEDKDIKAFIAKERENI